MDLQADLLSLHRQLREKMRREWKRSLPFEELLFDRWERASFLGFGAKASIYHDSYVYGDVQVGAGTWIGPYTLLDGSGGVVQIGTYVSIASGVHVYTHDTVQWALSGGKRSPEKGSVTIGDCTYIGPMSIVTRGVTIGDHCVIGANSIVTKDVPAYSFAAGSPAQIKGRMVEEPDGHFQIHRLKSSQG